MLKNKIETILNFFVQNLSRLEKVFVRLTLLSFSLFILKIGFDLPNRLNLILNSLNTVILVYFCFYTIFRVLVSTEKRKFLNQYKLSVILVLIVSIDIVVNFFSIDSVSSTSFFIGNESSNSFISAITQGLVFFALFSGQFSFLSKLEVLKLSPYKLFLGSFVALILFGTLLLSLPNSTTQGISLIDALFTATSAVCVTGLVTLDTATDFTRTGQVIILFLIQIGGLGIITLTSFFAYVGGQKARLQNTMIVKELMQSDHLSNINSVLVRVIFTTFFIEIVGALILFGYWGMEDSYSLNSLFYSVFFSISAFCNAGFSLYSDSFMSVHNDFLSLFVISILIILGGIGVKTLSELRHYIFTSSFDRKRFRFSVQSKLVMKTSGYLIIGGFVLFLLSEFGNSLSGLSFLEKLKAAFFQSVVSRTAGFNSVDFSLLSIPTSLWYMALMFIGGASGSTAGGIKVNTAAIIWLWLKEILHGKKTCVIYNRSIHISVFHQAILVFCGAVVYAMLAIILLSATENVKTIDLIFEVISALATVGLSKGITSDLSIFGKFVISFTMLVGRIGIISFALSLLNSKRSYEHRVKYPEEGVSVG